MDEFAACTNGYSIGDPFDADLYKLLRQGWCERRL
jgi:hypothetical protein